MREKVPGVSIDGCLLQRPPSVGRNTHHIGVQRVRGDADLERQNGRFKVFIVPPTV